MLFFIIFNVLLPGAYSLSVNLSCSQSDRSAVPGCGGTCSGTFTVEHDSLPRTGWLTLNATLDPTHTPSLAASLVACHRLLGWVEGTHLAQSLDDAAANLADATFPNRTLPTKVEAFLLDQWSYIKRSATAGSSDPFWRTAALWASQLQGLIDGYNHHRTTAGDAHGPLPARLSLPSLLSLSWAGDLEDLIPALGDYPPDGDGPPVGGRDCSAFVRSPSPDLSSLLVGHTTFNGYWCALRVFRSLHFRAPSSTTVAAGTAAPPPASLALPFSLQYSSRPGDLQSKDDFYVARSPTTTLSVVETSLAACNRTAVFAGLTPRSAPCWLRALVATRAATSPAAWTSLFATENSGTHNNQWLLSQPQPAQLLLVEQMGRGPLASSDLTDTLASRGFVGSYNTAFHPAIATLAGCGATAANYTTAPRARIFARDAAGTASLANLQQLMTSNAYQTDPISDGNPCRAISARCDLAKAGATAFGGIDAKVVDLSHAANTVLAISGMTTDSGLPPFSFTPRWNSVPHRGIPETFNFSWQRFAVADVVHTTKQLKEEAT